MFQQIFRLMVLIVLTLIVSPAFAVCNLNCKAKCTAFGITEPSCYNNCLIAERACTEAEKVITPAAKLVAQNLEWAFVIAPVTSTLILTLNYIVTEASGAQVTYSFEIPKTLPDSTGVSHDIEADCLYQSAPNGVTMYIVVNAAKPSWFDAVNRGDDLSVKSANVSCSPRAGSVPVSSASMRVSGKANFDEFTVFGRPTTAMSFAQPFAFEPPNNKPSPPDTLSMFGLLEESGVNYVVRFLDPGTNRSIEVPKSSATIKPTGVKVTPMGSVSPQEIKKVTLKPNAIVTLRQQGTAASAIAALARMQPLVAESSATCAASTGGSIGSLSSYPGDIACGVSKTTFIYWQAYALVKLAKDSGFIVNDKQCNDANYTATVVAAMIGGGEPIIELITGVFGSCICHDLF